MSNPIYRFCDYNDDYKSVHLREILTERNQKRCISNDYPLLSFTIEQGVIDPKDKKTNKRDFLTKDMEHKKYLTTELDDIIYNPSNIIFGAIGRNKLKKGVVSPIYAIFSTSENPKYMELLLSSKRFINFSLKYLEGTVIKLRTLKPNDFLNIKVNIPTKDEQNNIVKFFDLLDDKINLQIEKIDLFQKNYNFMCKNIFSTATIEKKLDELVINQTSNLSVGSLKSNSGNYKVYGASGLIDKIDSYMFDCSYIGIIKDGSGVGKSWVCDSNSSIIGTMSALLPKSNMDLDYLQLVVNSINFKKYMVGSGIPHIYFKDYKNEKVMIHCEEQQKLIGEYFKSLSKKIELETELLDKYREIKKGFVQNMFV